MISFEPISAQTGSYTLAGRLNLRMVTKMIDEHELLAQWSAGEKLGDLAFAKLYTKYNKKVVRDAKRLGGSPEDASQDVWLRLCEAVKNGTVPAYASLEEYLYRLTQKACARDAPDAGEPASTRLHEVPLAGLPTAPSAEDVVAVAELTELTERVVSRMPENIRLAWAHKRRGDTDAFASQQLEISLAEYKRRVHDARSIISEHLAREAL